MEIHPHHTDWIATLRECIAEEGVCVVKDILAAEDIQLYRDGLYSARRKIVDAIGTQRLQRAGEYSVLRIIMHYEPRFLRLLENQHLLAIVDNVLCDTAVLHLQNGFILPSFPADKAPAHFQSTLHRDFPRHLNGYMASLNVLIALDDFTAHNGGTVVVPKTHQQEQRPDPAYMEANALSITCRAGSAIVFDSTLWHASGVNISGNDRLAINHQFTRSFFKQQIDYVRALGEDAISALPERSKQLLGYYTRVPTSLDEYYRPEDERLYRKGQG